MRHAVYFITVNVTIDKVLNFMAFNFQVFEVVDMSYGLVWFSQKGKQTPWQQ